VSTVCTIALILFFLTPIALLVVNTGWSSESWEPVAEKMNLVFRAYGAVIYLTAMFLGTFFNVAFYHEILGALAGNPVSLQSGLRFAATRLRAILLWSLLAGTVGLLIKMIEERLGWLGRIMMGLLGTVWSVAAVFAIPVIIRRTGANPLAVLRDSAATLKRTWGESLIGFLGIQLMGAVFVLITLGFGMVGLVGLFVLDQGWILVAAIGMWLVAVLTWSFLISIATHVYRCALYVYASEGVVPSAYTPEMMNTAWKVKKA
jgi:hypothetical protein